MPRVNMACAVRKDVPKHRYEARHSSCCLLSRCKASEKFPKTVCLMRHLPPPTLIWRDWRLQIKNSPKPRSNWNAPLHSTPTLSTPWFSMTSTAYTNKHYDKALASARKVHGIPQHEQFVDLHLV